MREHDIHEENAELRAEIEQLKKTIFDLELSLGYEGTPRERFEHSVMDY